MVFGSHANTRAIYSTPPCPSLAASTAAYRRRSFSDSHPKNRRIFCSTSAAYPSMPRSLIQNGLCGKDTTASAIREVILDHILTGLRCLNDTRLQPTHRLVDRLPWDGMPVCREVGGSTSRSVRRHLHRPLDRFLKVSRPSTPQGSLPACASGDVATRIRPATGRPSLFPTPIPAPPLVGLTAFRPSRKE